MDNYNVKIELFTKKGKTVTIICWICAFALVALQFYIGIRMDMAVGCREDLQSYQLKLWERILCIVNFSLAEVLIVAGPAYQVIEDQRTERRKLYRRKQKKNKKKSIYKKVNLTVVFLLLLSIFIAVCAINIIPIAQDINNGSFATYDGPCTLYPHGTGGGRRVALFNERRILLNDLDFKVKGNPGLEEGEYYAHVVYSEKSKYVVSFSLIEEAQ